MLITQNIIDALKNQDVIVDPAQTILVKKLSQLKLDKKFSLNIRNFLRKRSLGIYIWGDVGRGKTLIVREYLNQLKKKDIKSFHYIDFMNYIHNELNKNSGLSDPLKQVAESIIKRHSLIFIDEFQVEDVADAMIVGSLLKKILESGTKIILTSNSHPHDLYKNGLQRQKFINSIDVCLEKLEIFELDGEIDYRTKNIIELDKNEKKFFSEKDIFELITFNFGSTFNNTNEIIINERKFKCKLSYRNILWIEFNNFFSDSTGTSDYKDISRRFDWIFINNFIVCDDDSADIIRRFISFIDIAYTEKVKVRFFFNDIDIENIYTGTKLDLLWSRCASRLEEMKTYDYLSDD